MVTHRGHHLIDHCRRVAATRTRLLLEGPIISTLLRTLLRLAAPNVVVNVVLIAVTGVAWVIERI
jgi:hypothetical protein